MQPSNNQTSPNRKRFKPKQSFDEYRLKHGPENRYYRSFNDPENDRVSHRRRTQIILAIFVIIFAVAVTFIITRYV